MLGEADASACDRPPGLYVVTNPARTSVLMYACVCVDVWMHVRDREVGR